MKERNNMELRVLKYFLEVAREGSFTNAADSLHLSQSTLSKQIQNLEEELGKKLFVRGGKTICLTDEGRILSDRAKQLLSLAEKTKTDIAENRDTLSGCVRICTGENVIVRYIARAISKIRTEYPMVTFDIHSCDGDDALKRLNRDQCDIAFMYTHCMDNDKIIEKCSISESYGILMRSDHPLAKKEKLSRSDINGIPLIIPRYRTEELLDEDFYGGLNLAGTYNLLHNAVIMAEENACCALVLEFSPENGMIFRPLTPACHANIYIVRQKNKALSKAAELFLRCFNDEISDV